MSLLVRRFSALEGIVERVPQSSRGQLTTPLSLLRAARGVFPPPCGDALAMQTLVSERLQRLQTTLEARYVGAAAVAPVDLVGVPAFAADDVIFVDEPGLPGGGGAGGSRGAGEGSAGTGGTLPTVASMSRALALIGIKVLAAKCRENGHALWSEVCAVRHAPLGSSVACVCALRLPLQSMHCRDW